MTTGLCKEYDGDQEDAGCVSFSQSGMLVAMHKTSDLETCFADVPTDKLRKSTIRMILRAYKGTLLAVSTKKELWIVPGLCQSMELPSKQAHLNLQQGD